MRYKIKQIREYKSNIIFLLFSIYLDYTNININAFNDACFDILL